MAEYIEKQEAIDALGEEPEVWTTDNEWDMGAQEQWRFDHAAIDAVPPADVRPVVRGKWIPEPDRHYHWHCSECGYTVGVIRMDCKFCPNCGSYNGADMRGGDTDGNTQD